MGVLTNRQFGDRHPPKTRMNSAITQAKMGLSMKKRGMTRAPSTKRPGCRCRCGRGRRRRRHRCGRRPGHGLDGGLGVHHFLEAIDHDLLARLQAAQHHPLFAPRATQLDGTGRTLPSASTTMTVSAWPTRDRLLRRQHAPSTSACSRRTRTYMPGSKGPSGLGKLGTQRHLA